MTALGPQWHTQIRAALTKRPETMLETTSLLWELLAFELVPIIGHGGFNSLYARTVHLTRVDFPWLNNAHPTTGTEFFFTRVSECLEQQPSAQACEASARLLITFLDILATLIGEPMTNTIISSIWSDAALNHKKEV